MWYLSIELLSVIFSWGREQCILYIKWKFDYYHHLYHQRIFCLFKFFYLFYHFIKLLTLYTITSVYIFTILFSINFANKEKFVQQARASFVGDHFLYSCDCNVWLRGDIVRRNEILVTPRIQRVNMKPTCSQCFKTTCIPILEIFAHKQVCNLFRTLSFRFFRKKYSLPSVKPLCSYYSILFSSTF